MWDFDDFSGMNPADKRQDISRLEHLCRIGATNPSFLGIAYELLDKQTRSLACFAQLPYATVTEFKSMVRPGTSRLFELHFFPATIEIQDDGSQKLLGPDKFSTTSNEIPITQIVAIVKYWGIRGKWYSAYTRMVTPTGLRDGVFVPTEASWLEKHQPLAGDDFENDLGKRLLIDCLEAIRRGLPFDLAKEYQRLLNYFIMPFPGRIAFGGKPIPTIRHLNVKHLASEKTIPESMEPKINYVSVFLSYGGPDESTAMALRNELKKHGVESWWFPEDAQWGEKIYLEVSRNIKKYDRLLLLCSRRSLIRKGVLHELEEVLEREAVEGGKEIIVPIALDDVLNEEWWKFEPRRTGDTVMEKIDSNEIMRRRELTDVLRRRVIGDLKEASPGDEKWNRAIPRLLNALMLSSN